MELLITVRGLRKRFGRHLAVDDLSFDVPEGRVTGFLGPNGAGKTTTLRMILGLARPTSGAATVMGQPYAALKRPGREIGVLLDPGTFHPKRTAGHHLRWVAAASHISRRHVDEVLGVVDLEAAADRRVGGFSTGMRQRLGLASALLGEPRLLILDEPANGLDPAGITWLREFLRSYAASGGTVFVSSHILAEIARVADEAVVIHRGRLVAHTSIEDLTSGVSRSTRVRTPQSDELGEALTADGAKVVDEGAGVLTVTDTRPERVGTIAAERGIVLHELVGATRSLEEVFFDLTRPEESDG